MSYQVRDRVIVREDLAPHTEYHMENGINADIVVEDMFDFLGKVVTIEDVFDTCYSIKECGWNWTDGMFAGLAEVPFNLSVDVSEFL